MTLTATMADHLATAASQALAAACSDAYSAGITRAGFNRLGTLRALERRGLLLSSERLGLARFDLTPQGWEVVADYARELCADKIEKAARRLVDFAEYPGLVALAEADLAGAKKILALLD
jgi:hypothetical protein